MQLVIVDARTCLRSIVPTALPTMATGTSASPRGTSGASTRPLAARTASPATLMGKKYRALVPRNSCFGRLREARSRTIGGAARPVEVESAPLAEPATSDKEDLVDMEEPGLINGLGGFAEAAMAEFMRTANAGSATS